MASRRVWLAFLGILTIAGIVAGSAWWRSPDRVETEEELFVDDLASNATANDVTLGDAAATSVPEALPLLPRVSRVSFAETSEAQPPLEIPPWVPVSGVQSSTAAAVVTDWARFEQPPSQPATLSPQDAFANRASTGNDAVWLDGTIETFDDVPLWPGGSAFLPATRPDVVAP